MSQDDIQEKLDKLSQDELQKIDDEIKKAYDSKLNYNDWFDELTDDELKAKKIDIENAFKYISFPEDYDISYKCFKTYDNVYSSAEPSEFFTWYLALVNDFPFKGCQQLYAAKCYYHEDVYNDIENDNGGSGKWTITYSEYRYGIDPIDPSNPVITKRKVICTPFSIGDRIAGWSGSANAWCQPEGSDDWKEVEVSWFMDLYEDGSNGIGMGMVGYNFWLQGIDFAKLIAESGENIFYHEIESSPNGTYGIAYPTNISYSWSLDGI